MRPGSRRPPRTRAGACGTGRDRFRRIPPAGGASERVSASAASTTLPSISAACCRERRKDPAHRRAVVVARDRGHRNVHVAGPQTGAAQRGVGPQPAGEHSPRGFTRAREASTAVAPAMKAANRIWLFTNCPRQEFAAQTGCDRGAR